MQLTGDMLTHGVYIVCAAKAGVRAGLTVAWATQLAQDQVLICLGAQSRTRELILASGAFGLSVLAADQVALAAFFGSRHSDEEAKFHEIVTVKGATGSPLLEDCVLALDCRLVSEQEHGTEKLIIGQIVGTREGRRDDQRLIYTAADY